jgi:hypothetical protein
LRNLISAYEHSGSPDKVAEMNELLQIIDTPNSSNSTSPFRIPTE